MLTSEAGGGHGDETARSDPRLEWYRGAGTLTSSRLRLYAGELIDYWRTIIEIQEALSYECADFRDLRRTGSPWSQLLYRGAD